MKRFISPFLILIAVALLSKFAYIQAKGFTLLSVTKTAFTSDWETSSSSFPQQAKQPYHLFAKGRQAFVFISEDKQYILKVFKHRYPFQTLFCKAVSHAPWIGEKARNTLTKLKKKKERLLSSLVIADELLKPYTALVFTHPFKTKETFGKISIYDAQKICHSLDLDTSCFVLQKPSIMLYDYLRELKKENKLVEAQGIIKKLIDYLFFRADLGILDSDCLLRKNFAVYDGEIVQIDVGSFSFSDEAKAIPYQQEEMQRIITSLHYFLQDEYNGLQDYLNAYLQNQLKLKKNAL